MSSSKRAQASKRSSENSRMVWGSDEGPRPSATPTSMGGDLTETNKVWFYLINLVFKPSKHISTMRQDRALLL